MQPRTKPIPPQPLLSFPPTPASRPLPPYAPPAPPPRPSTIRRVFLALPLVFVYGLLSFVTYAFLLNLCFNYLLFTLHAPRGLLEAAIFTWLCVGCGWSLLQCFLRGGGAVPRRLGDLEAAGYQDHSLPLASHPAFPSHKPPTKPTAPAEEAGLLDDDDNNNTDDDDAALEAEILADQQRERQRGGKLQAREAAPGMERRTSGGKVGSARVDSGWDFGAALRDLEAHAPREEGGASGGGRGSSLQAKSDGSVRFCRKCRVPKPDRAHHCSSCGTCVLKMDHHCPWLGGGCVGWANYKFFLLFLLYSGALGNYVAVVSACELAWFVGSAEENFALAPVSWAVAMLLGFVFGLAVGGFGLYHVWLACSNKTTIESMERAPVVALDDGEEGGGQGEGKAKLRDYYELNKVERRRMDKAASSNHVYDLGWKRNLAEVFGGWDRRWEWLWPVGWPPGDGHTFPVDRAKLERLRAVTREIRVVRPREEGPRVRY